MKIQTDFSAMGLTIFELWVMKTQNPNTPSVSVTHNFVSITYNSKIVGPMAEKSIWIFITLFPVFFSIT